MSNCFIFSSAVSIGTMTSSLLYIDSSLTGCDRLFHCHRLRSCSAIISNCSICSSAVSRTSSSDPPVSKALSCTTKQVNNIWGWHGIQQGFILDIVLPAQNHMFYPFDEQLKILLLLLLHVCEEKRRRKIFSSGDQRVHLLISVRRMANVQAMLTYLHVNYVCNK